MTRDRTQAIGAGLALVVLAVLVVIDISIPPEVAIISAMFGLAPLIACAVVGVAGTASIAGLAVFAAAISGLWNGTFGTTQHDVRILNVLLVGSAAVAIAAVRVHRERRFAQVSEIAQVAQRAILPVLPARAGHIATAARYQSAARGAMVGGDLYDCYHSSEHIRLVVGDVRGKGIAGVEQAARVIRAFRQSAALHSSLSEVAEEMDAYLVDFFSEEEFVTVLLVDVTEPGLLRMISAGHPGPQLVGPEDAHTVELPSALPLGLGLGRWPGSYVESAVRWGPGDRLLMFTDGLSEARDSQGTFFPVSSLDEVLRSKSIQQAAEGSVVAVSEHVPRGRLKDDIAVVVIEHLPDVKPQRKVSSSTAAAPATRPG